MKITATGTELNAAGATTTALVVETNRAQVAEALLTPLTSIFGSMTIATAPVSDTQATITVTCKDIGGATLAAAKTFMFWFTAPGQDTTPDEDGIESWSYVTHGTLNANFDLGLDASAGTNIVRVGTTHTDGTMDFLVTCDSGPWTNRFAVLGPNGSYSNLPIVYVAP